MPEHPHGTIERYREYPKGTARCQPCRDAWAAHQRQRRADARAEVARRPGGEVAEGEGARLARLWAAERGTEGEVLEVADVLGDQADDLGCGHPGRWTTDHTAVVCEQCKTRGTSPGSSALADALEARRKQHTPKRGEVVPRVTEAEARRARVQLHAAKRQAEKYLGELLADLEHAGELAEAEGNDYVAARAEGLYDLAEGYEAEIAEADTLELLRELLSDLDNVRRGGDFGTLMTFVNQLEVQAERRLQLEERQAEVRRREAEAEREAEQRRREAERAEREQRRQLTSARAASGELARRQSSAVSQNGYATGILMVAQIAEGYRRDKERKLSQHGPCGYEHRKPVIPERRYWIATQDWQGNATSYELPGAPSAAVCHKHFAAADAWIEQQAALIARQRGVQVTAVYTELK